jgi:septum formation protein
MNAKPSFSQLLLASSSPRRKELLREAGYDFEVMAPAEEAECGACSGDGPAALVTELAVRKARDVRGRLGPEHADRVLVACDTVAECGGRILGKPADLEHARQMLQSLSGREHRVYSGLCVWRPQDDEPEVRVAVTTLRMDKLSTEQLADYLESCVWEGKAGAFGYQDRLGWVHIVEGSESNVVGLPMELLAEMLG